MASLTSARARRAGGAGASGTAGDEVRHDYANAVDVVDDDESETKGKSAAATYPPPLYPEKVGSLAPSQRPFGSTTPAHNHSQSGTATSGWVTSGAYVDKGKTGKPQRASKYGEENAKTGTGPLRRYGGGLGVVSHGEFKLLIVVTLLASVVRLWKLDRPSSVVFDEVHFGGFATKYIKQKFFMDVHPPLAKLLITFAAWFAGFRGNFDFKDIGKEYGPDHVPYIAMRLLPASMGIALVPLSYLTLRSLGCRPATALLGSLLVTFENGLITQSRLILLDSPLMFFTGLTTFFWVGFSSEDARRAGSSCQGAFSKTWWSWLSLTGLCLGLTLACKWVGLFTIATIGVAVLEQLWHLLGDTRVSMKNIGRHFVARGICLLGIPMATYMFWFSIHFAVLSHSGDGDGFMSSEFQHTLYGHGMADTYADVMLGSRVTLRHADTQGGYLHSHPHNYPGGSKQQQITLYPHRDDNNDWLIVNETQIIGKESDPSKHGPLTHVLDKTIIRLHHPSTAKKLHSHDIRAPVSEVDFQNEVSAYGFDNFDGDANDNFQIEIVPDLSDSRDRHAKKRLRTLRTKFRLRHVLTGCYLFSHKVKLPEWGFEQQEVTCNKNPTLHNSVWYIETNKHDLLPEKSEKVNYRRPGFLTKFLELQAVMWRTNAGLTDRHAYDSRPHQWPYLRRGINFWVKDHRQIYLIGNPITWWFSSFSVFLYAAARGLLIVRAKRGYKDLNNTTVQFYDRLCGFLFIGWFLHYFPFFIMQRQLFLHHYFPALYYSILLFAAVFDLATSALKPKIRVQIAAVVLIMALWAYVHWSPLAYAGRWTKSECEDAKWLKNWDFSCNDFHKSYAEYDTVPHPTESKPVVVGGDVNPSGNAEAVQNAAEKETPSDNKIEEVIAPGQNAFAKGEDEPAPAPKSSAADRELFKQAESAHKEAEAKAAGEDGQGKDAKDDNVEPTNVPGAERPVEQIAEVIKSEVQQEVVKEAPVPLEEAAPTPSDETTTAATTASASVAIVDDTAEEAGKRKARLAQVDDQQVRQKGVKRPIVQALNDHADDEPLEPVEEEEADAPMDEPIFNIDAQEDETVKPKEEATVPDPADALGAAAEKGKQAVKAAVKKVIPPAKNPNIVLDADEKAAQEERERHRLAQLNDAQ